MNDYEQWLQGQKARQEQRVLARQTALEQARIQYVNRRVWVSGSPFEGYAWVTAIDDRGFVFLHFEEVPYGFSDHCSMQFEALGSSITLCL